MPHGSKGLAPRNGRCGCSPPRFWRSGENVYVCARVHLLRESGGRADGRERGCTPAAERERKECNVRGWQKRCTKHEGQVNKDDEGRGSDSLPPSNSPHPVPAEPLGRPEPYRMRGRLPAAPISHLLTLARLACHQGLRVADASVAPRIPCAPTQAMSYMIGHRACELILRGL